jgi:hypothetical protein
MNRKLTIKADELESLKKVSEYLTHCIDNMERTSQEGDTVVASGDIKVFLTEDCEYVIVEDIANAQATIEIPTEWFEYIASALLTNLGWVCAPPVTKSPSIQDVKAQGAEPHVET